jgi:nicotinate-nucleotide adenylyltransferase
VTSERAIGLLGGTFDPPHIGHLRAAIESLELLPISALRLIPCALPPHRAHPAVGAAQRVAMLEAAIADVPALSCDRRELDRTGPSFTVDTLTSIRAEVGDRPLVFILGADAFAGLATWHRWREIFDLAHMVVLTRPDAHALIDPRLETEMAHRATSDASSLASSPSGRIHRLEIPLLPVSSTLIRQRIEQRRSIAHLVPPAVARMIAEQGWYRRL